MSPGEPCHPKGIPSAFSLAEIIWFTPCMKRFMSDYNLITSFDFPRISDAAFSSRRSGLNQILVILPDLSIQLNEPWREQPLQPQDSKIITINSGAHHHLI